MRTTIDLPEDLHRIAIALARATERSLSDTVAELVRRGLAAEHAPRQDIRSDPNTGFPLVRSARPITLDDVQALDDET